MQEGGKAKVLDESKIQYLRSYGRLYGHVAHIIKDMERQEWMTAAKYCRDALAEMVEQIYRLYSCRVEGGTLWVKCQILENAKIISPQSMENYNAIRECGNAASHPEDPKYTNYAFNKNTLTKIVSLLLEETIIFTESYAVDLVENGKQRIQQAHDKLLNQNGNAKKGRTQLLSPLAVRVLSIGCLILAAVGVWMFLDATEDAGGQAVGIIVAIVCGIIGMFGLITGDDSLLLIALIRRTR